MSDHSDLRAELVSATLTYAIARDGYLAARDQWAKHQNPSARLVFAIQETGDAAVAAHNAMLKAARALISAGGRP